MAYMHQLRGPDGHSVGAGVPPNNLLAILKLHSSSASVHSEGEKTTEHLHRYSQQHSKTFVKNIVNSAVDCSSRVSGRLLGSILIYKHAALHAMHEGRFGV